VTNNYIALTTR